MRTIKQEIDHPIGIASRGESFRDPVLRRGWGGRRPTSAMERWLLKTMLGELGNPPVAITTWDGQTVTNPCSPPPSGLIHVRLRDSNALLRLALDPEYQFGELYSNHRLEVDGDLAALIEAIYVAQGNRRGLLNWLSSHIHAPRSNLLGQTAANIHHHYDIGNDFYRLWLDREMLYTCAYYPEPTASLEAAQLAKMDMICRKLRLKPGERVVEAGCGWGALALFMAREYGVRVLAFNISSRQIAHARQRAHAEGLHDRVGFVEADYRAIRGEYDVFVSVGMLEHVGRNHYQELGGVINRCLTKQGRGFIHSIGTDYPTPLNPWIEQRIFPGAYPPTLSETMQVLETAGMSVLDVENLRLHYARTLTHWLERFEASADRVETMFGMPFVRAWRLYLAGSLAAFRTGRLQLFQVLFQRNGDNDIAWTRAALYRDGGEPCKPSTS